MASLTQWRLVWVNPRSRWWIGRPGVLCGPWGREESRHNRVTELNWTDGLRGLFWYSWAQWLVALHWKHSFLLLLPLYGWLSLLLSFGSSWVAGHGCGQAINSAWTLACLYSCQVLSSSSVWSRLLNTPKVTSRCWGLGVCRFKSWVLFFLLGHFLDLFPVDWPPNALSLPFDWNWTCGSCSFSPSPPPLGIISQIGSKCGIVLSPLLSTLGWQCAPGLLSRSFAPPLG